MVQSDWLPILHQMRVIDCPFREPLKARQKATPFRTTRREAVTREAGRQKDSRINGKRMQANYWPMPTKLSGQPIAPSHHEHRDATYHAMQPVSRSQAYNSCSRHFFQKVLFCPCPEPLVWQTTAGRDYHSGANCKLLRHHPGPGSLRRSGLVDKGGG